MPDKRKKRPRARKGPDSAGIPLLSAEGRLARRARSPEATVAEGNGVAPSLDRRYRVIKDTREKSGQGWTFKETGKCAGMVRGTMKTGDYTLAGYEDVVCIERKGTVGEFARNICEPRFWRELERMKEFSLSALILEFSLEDVMKWPSGSGIPKYKWKYIRVRSKFILSSIKKIEEEFPTIKVILAGSDGQRQARLLFAKAVKSESEKNKH